MKKINETQIQQLDWLLSQATFPTVKLWEVIKITNILHSLEDSKEEEFEKNLEEKNQEIENTQRENIEELKFLNKKIDGREKINQEKLENVIKDYNEIIEELEKKHKHNIKLKTNTIKKLKWQLSKNK